MALELKTRNQIFNRLLAGYEGNVLPMNASAIRSMRLKHVHQKLQDEVAALSVPLYDGEERLYLFKEIMRCTDSVFSFNYSPGQITSSFLNISAQYALMTRYLALGSLKAMSDQIQNDILSNSELGFVLGATLKGETGAAKVKELFTALTKFNVSKFEPGDLYRMEFTEEEAAGLVSETGALYSNLLTYIGTSRGVALTAEARKARVSEFSKVIDAIGWLGQISDALITMRAIKGTAPMTPEQMIAATPLMQLDAWTLASALATYFKWITAEESPWPVIPPPSSPLTASQNLKRHANYLSVVYASIGTAYMSGEIHMAIKAFEGTASVWSPLLDTRPEAVKDINNRLAAIRSRFSSPNPYTIALTDQALRALTDHFGVSHWILPGDETLESLRAQVLDKLPASSDVTDYTGISKVTSRSVTLSYMARENVLISLDGYLDIVEAAVALYSVSTKLHETMLLDDMGISAQFILTASDAPVVPLVKHISQVTYASLNESSPYVSVMPRFARRANYEEPSRWILADALYKPKYRSLLYLEKVDFDERYVWPNRGRLSLGETVTIPYMKLPLPTAYTEEVSPELQPYTVDSFFSLIQGHTEGIHSRDYLKTFFEVMLSTDGQWDSLLMNAIAGAFIVQKKAGSSWTTVYPSLPAIYGAPTKLLIDTNVKHKPDSLKWHEVKLIGGTFRVLPYAWLPKPMPCYFTQFQWTRGAYVNVPVGVFFLNPQYVDGVKEVDNADYVQFEYNITRASFSGDPAKRPELFVRSWGWAPFVTVLPHVLFRPVTPFAANFPQDDDLKVAACIRTMFRKENELGMLSFMAAFEDTVIVLDADDELKGIEPSDPGPGGAPVVDGGAPALAGRERSAGSNRPGTTLGNAPADIDPVIVGGGDSPEGTVKISGPGTTQIAGAPPTVGGAAAVITEKSPAAIITQDDTIIEDVAQTEVAKDGSRHVPDDSDLIGGALIGSPDEDCHSEKDIRKRLADLKEFLQSSGSEEGGGLSDDAKQAISERISTLEKLLKKLKPQKGEADNTKADE